MTYTCWFRLWVVLMGDSIIVSLSVFGASWTLTSWKFTNLAPYFVIIFPVLHFWKLEHCSRESDYIGLFSTLSIYFKLSRLIAFLVILFLLKSDVFNLRVGIFTFILSIEPSSRCFLPLNLELSWQCSWDSGYVIFGSGIPRFLRLFLLFL